MCSGVVYANIQRRTCLSFRSLSISSPAKHKHQHAPLTVKSPSRAPTIHCNVSSILSLSDKTPVFPHSQTQQNCYKRLTDMSLWNIAIDWYFFFLLWIPGNTRLSAWRLLDWRALVQSLHRTKAWRICEGGTTVGLASLRFLAALQHETSYYFAWIMRFY